VLFCSFYSAQVKKLAVTGARFLVQPWGRVGLMAARDALRGLFYNVARFPAAVHT